MRRHRPAIENGTVRLEYVPGGVWYKYNDYEEYLMDVEAFLYKGYTFMYKREKVENAEERAKKEIWEMLGMPRKTGAFVGDRGERRATIPTTETPLTTIPYGNLNQ